MFCVYLTGCTSLLHLGLFMENMGVWRANGFIGLRPAGGNECKKALPRPAILGRESSRNIRDGKLFVWLKPGLEESEVFR